MVRVVTLLLGLLAGLTSAAPLAARDSPKLLQAQAPTPNCTCRAQGRSFAIGETTCLRTDEGPRLAECGMAINVTSWKLTTRPCPES